MIERVNRACKFFPCHRGLEDCTFCYCPFYPCLDKKKGRFIYSPKRRRGIWSCHDCGWIHKTRVTERIFALLKKNKGGIKKNIFIPNAKRRVPKSGKTGIIVLSHGSRLKKANAGLAQIVRAIKQKTRLDIIVPAYLQFCRPTLEKSAQTLIAKGCRTIIIVPFFLFNGNHVTRDIPYIIGKERAKYPKVDFLCTKNVGEDARIPGIVSDIVEEALI